MKHTTWLLIVGLTASVAIGQQIQSTTIDLTRPNRDFAFKAAEQSTPVYRAYIREDGSPYTDMTGLHGVFFFASNATASVGMLVTNTATGQDYLEWTLTKDQTVEPGSYFAQMIVTNATGLIQEWVRGTYTILDSPGTTAAGTWSWNATNYATQAWVTEQLAMGGDLTGPSTNATVTAIRGRTVTATAPTVGQLLQWTGSMLVWTNIAGVTESDPVFAAWLLTMATPTQNWNTAYSWGPHAGLYVPTNRTITINGVTYSLDANRTWTVGTTDHTALSNLAWTESGHTGTAGRVAYFGEGGVAGYAPAGAGITFASDSIAVSNDIITGAAAGAVAQGWGNHATNGYLTAEAQTLSDVLALGNDAAGGSITNLQSTEYKADWKVRENLDYFVIGNDVMNISFDPFTPAYTFSGSGNAGIVAPSFTGDGSGLTGLPTGLSSNEAVAIATAAARSPSVESFRLTSAPTVTVSQAYSQFDLYVTDAICEIAFDTASYSTNYGHTIAVSLWAGTNVISADAASVDAVTWTAATISSTNWNDLIFRKAPHATRFNVQAEASR